MNVTAPRFVSRLGYDTRSLRSALVMRTIDAINPFKRAQPFEWRDPCVVSSVAGLGDLFIHLPLISGIVKTARLEGLNVSVALRPAHLDIGRKFGWDVFPFDNGLEDFFKNPAAFSFSHFVNSIRAERKHSRNLWIDLTGSAVSALAIKAAGAKRLAARTTRGGKSLIDHPLPHVPQENEYGNRQRVAEFLGCEVDLTLAPPCANDGTVVLCLTTASRWKNWPLRNFRALIERFPHTTFTVIGLIREILPEELRDLNELVRRPNVVDRIDQLSVSDVVDSIANCRAVVTNDTSAAHIANFFGKPGAVLFGPVSPQTFAAPDGLRVFHDSTCPFHPCVQWRCDNQENWCMRKIEVSEVAEHLDNILIRHPQDPLLSVSHPPHSSTHQPNWQRQLQLPV